MRSSTRERYSTSNSEYGSHSKKEIMAETATLTERNALPIGVANIGISCWFSSLSQLLFHIPAARKAVFHILPPHDNQPNSDRRAALCKALQLQFAVMQDRRLAAADPRPAIRTLDALYPGERIEHAQKDAVEMFCRVLTVLETMSARESGEEPELTNIFGGIIREYKMMDDKEWHWMDPPIDKTIFSFPLIPSIGNAQAAMNDYFFKEDHERWIIELSPILLLPIARYTYEGGTTRKKHDRFEFTKEIFVDRYMYSEKEAVMKAHSQYESIKKAADKLRGTIQALDVSQERSGWVVSAAQRLVGHSNDVAVNKTAIDKMKLQLDKYEATENPLEANGFKHIAYDLHAVVVHSGETAESGHYFMYVREDVNGSQWLLFNDSKVFKAPWAEVVQNAFGHKDGKSFTSAVALLYMRRSEIDNLCDYEYRLSSENIEDYSLDRMESLPEHVRTMLQEHYRVEKEERTTRTQGMQQSNEMEKTQPIDNTVQNMIPSSSSPTPTDMPRFAPGTDQGAAEWADLQRVMKESINESIVNDATTSSAAFGQVTMEMGGQLSAAIPSMSSAPGVDKAKVAILYSGEGRSVMGLTQASMQPDCPFQVVAVLSDVNGVYCQVANREMVLRTHFTNIAELENLLLIYQVELVCLDQLRYPLTHDFVNHWNGRIMYVNATLHPEAYRDCDPYMMTLHQRMRVSGCTFFTFNRGRMVIQDQEPVRVPDDANAEMLKEMIWNTAEAAYPRAVNEWASRYNKWKKEE